MIFRSKMVSILRASILSCSSSRASFTSTAAHVEDHHDKAVTQKSSSTNWVVENKLFQKYPRLRFLGHKCNSLGKLKQLLSYIFVSGFHRNPFVMSRVLYLCFMGLENEDDTVKRVYGNLVFSQIEEPNTFSWNTMIRVFAISEDPCDATVSFGYYIEMLHRGMLPDKYTYPFLLQACGSTIDGLDLLKQVHCHSVILGLFLDLFVQNALLHMYLVYGCFSEALQLFDEMIERDVVSWTTLISGLVTQGCYAEGLLVFNRMMADKLNVHPNAATLVSVASACADLGSWDHTKCLHAYLEKAWCGEIDVSIKNSLVDAYAKCGSIKYASQMFHEMFDLQRDLYSWTTMITGFAMHGQGREAFILFMQMKRLVGVVPDAITFVSVLSACAHSGLVEEGLQIFESMQVEFGIVPELKHFGCMVDLFGRAGLLKDAYEFVERMPAEPNLAILGSLLSACRLHNNVELGEVVLKKIESLCEHGGGAHVLLSNMYAKEKRWYEVLHIREGMWEGDKRNGKPPGRSWIQVKGVVNEFIAGDKSHSQTTELYIVLDGLGRLLLLH